MHLLVGEEPFRLLLFCSLGWLFLKLMNYDAGYMELTKREEFQADAHLMSMEYRVNTRNHLRMRKDTPGFDWDLYIEYQKSRVRSMVEYVFLVIKRLFEYRKVRYRGFEKNRTHAYILGVSVNAFMLAQSGWRMG